jgi:hypothetical protein
VIESWKAWPVPVELKRTISMRSQRLTVVLVLK